MHPIIAGKLCLHKMGMSVGYPPNICVLRDHLGMDTKNHCFARVHRLPLGINECT